MRMLEWRHNHRKWIFVAGKRLNAVRVRQRKFRADSQGRNKRDEEKNEREPQTPASPQPDAAEATRLSADNLNREFRREYRA